MREQFDLLVNYVRGMWRFRWYALAAAWVIAGVGWAASLQMPDQYRASAQIHVDTESMLKPLMRGLVLESNVERRVALMTKTLLSRPNLEEIARRVDLDLRADSAVDRERIIRDLESRLRLSGTGRDNIYNIDYTHAEPRLARDVVQGAVNLMIEESMGQTRADTDSATRFLDRKIEEYAARADAAEQRVIDFRREHASELAGSGGDFYQRLENARGQLEEARFQLELARSRERELERQLAGETPVFGMMAESGPRAEVATPELDDRISRLDDEIEELLLKYTREHPRVSGLELRLARLEREREAERQRLAAERAQTPATAGVDLDRNPVHQGIRAALVSARSDVASATSRVDQYRDRIAALEQRVDTVPEVEARFADLTAERNSIKTRLDELVERRQTAEISSEVERSEDQVEFRLVEPPRVPTAPDAPNRPLLVTASLGAAAAGYGGTGLLLALLWPAFYTRVGLQEALQLPVLGAVEHVRTARVRRRRWLEGCLYCLGVGLLAAGYGGVLLLAAGYGDPLLRAVGLA